MATPAGRVHVPVEKITVAAYTIPTDQPESDGTFAWDKTTIVVVHATAGGQRGLGYSYADTSTAQFIHDHLAAVVCDRDATAVNGTWVAMVQAVRNLGRPGVSSMAISAVDVALWDLKARLLGVALSALLGKVHDSIPVYGSGGFTSYSDQTLRDQLGGWAAQGFRFVKMKIGREPARDLHRVRLARAAIGDDCQLFVDANGALTRKQALAFAEQFRDCGVTWFEEPVSSDDLDGLRLLRDRGPAGMDIAAGEYGYDLPYFRRMLEAGAVDVLQADATRCGGVTGFLQVGPLCASRALRLSAHCAPNLHAPLCCALGPAEHVEYFHDHARIEHLFFDGALRPQDGALRPDPSRPGLGLELKVADAQRYQVL